MHKEYGATKKWNTYSINRSGKVYEHYDPKLYSDFLGIKEVDKHSISVVLENMGALVRTNSGDYINWLNEKCDPQSVTQKSWMGQQYWETIGDDQYNALIDLCEKVCEDFKIPKKIIEFHHFHQDASKFNGILFRSNYVEDSSDINPLFDIVKFAELLKIDIA